MARLHCLIALVALTLLPLIAHAHPGHVCTSVAAGCTEGEAYAEAQAHAESQSGGSLYVCVWQNSDDIAASRWRGGVSTTEASCPAGASFVSPSYYGTSCELVECCSDVFTAWPTGGEQSMCIAGCEFTPDGGDLECGSVGGEPWCIYTGDLTPTGDVCGEPSEYEPIDDPDPNDEWRCDPSTGVCLDENDNPHHCTFDGGGSPVNCVPFTDSDGDGVQDPDDPDPEDPDYSDDEDTDGDGIPDQRDPYPNDATNGTQDSPEADGPVDPDADNVASGGGTCGAPPSCSGDGIGCAILWQTWRRGCDTKELLGQLTQVGELGDDDTEGVTVSEQLDLLEQLDTITAPGGGACPQPPTFNAFGQTYELPFTDVLCPLFAVLAPLIVFGAYLAAARIVLE